MIKLNVGTADRGVRIAAGLVLLGLTLAGTIGPWGYLGVVPLITGLAGRCPLYSVVGIDTCPRR